MLLVMLMNISCSGRLICVLLFICISMFLLVRVVLRWVKILLLCLKWWLRKCSVFLLLVRVVDRVCSCMLVGRLFSLFSVVEGWLLMNIRCGDGMLVSSVGLILVVVSGVGWKLWCFSWCSEVYF